MRDPARELLSAERDPPAVKVEFDFPCWRVFRRFLLPIFAEHILVASH